MNHPATRLGMGLDDFVQAHEAQPFELIGDERLTKMPTVVGHSETIRRLFLTLYPYVSSRGLGEIYQETTFILIDADDPQWVRGSRTPDVMFYRSERIATYRAAVPGWRDRPYALVPDLVIEVVSPTDSYTRLDEKVDLYLADGVQVTLVVDPQRRKVTLDVAEGGHRKLSGDAELDLSAVIDGLKLTLAELFGA